jgi:hypothetical protein
MNDEHSSLFDDVRHADESDTDVTETITLSDGTTILGVDPFEPVSVKSTSVTRD